MLPDFIDWHFHLGMSLVIAMFYLGRNWEGWLSILRRRSEPEPESSYHRWHRSQGIRGACLCMDCNPQPTSPPPSAYSGHQTHRSGLQGLPNVSRASTPEPRGKQGNED